MDDIEKKSQELMAKFKDLQGKVRESFDRTDALLSDFGLTRNMLDPLIQSVRKTLSPADQRRLEQYEQSKRSEELYSGMAAEGSESTTTRKPKRLRAELMNRI